jgi:hypothetical protein
MSDIIGRDGVGAVKGDDFSKSAGLGKSPKLLTAIYESG